jgi:hypothetical protein
MGDKWLGAAAMMQADERTARECKRVDDQGGAARLTLERNRRMKIIIKASWHKQQHDCDPARPPLSFPWSKEKSKRVTAFHRIRDIDRPAPLSGGEYKYAIREKTPSKTVDTKGLGRAGFSEDSF